MTTDDGSRIARDPSAPSPAGAPLEAAVSARRAAVRKALLEQRMQHAPSACAQNALLARLQTEVESRLGGLSAMRDRVMAVYWPIRGEPSLGALPQRWTQAGVQLALPVVSGRHLPLQWVAWAPGDPMSAGAYGIATPAVQRPVRPVVLLVPCVGFDRRGFRIGYGGGYYDRTLAALAADGPVRPIAIGVAWDEGWLDDTEPLATDVPMDLVVTPSGVYPNAT